MLIWEPFIASFTGQLKTFVTRTGYRFTLDKNGLSVAKGQPFMVQFDQTENKVRMLPVYMPSPEIGMKR